MMVSDEEYQKHTVFADLEQYAAFYKHLAMSVFGFVPLGTRAICNIDCVRPLNPVRLCGSAPPVVLRVADWRPAVAMWPDLCDVLLT